VDRFGNLVTNIEAAHLPLVRSVDIGFVSIAGLAPTFGEVAHGELLALVGSSGFLEVCVRDGSAFARLGVHRGTKVVVRGAPRDA
jgi:S-adenosyl-L-methionine hydrolase (adenosine-forming)